MRFAIGMGVAMLCMMGIIAGYVYMACQMPPQIELSYETEAR